MSQRMPRLRTRSRPRPGAYAESEVSSDDEDIEIIDVDVSSDDFIAPDDEVSEDDDDGLPITPYLNPVNNFQNIAIQSDSNNSSDVRLAQTSAPGTTTASSAITSTAGPSRMRRRSDEMSDSHESVAKKVCKTEDAEGDPANTSVLSENGEGSNCPICMDAWTNSGAHRLVCLKCGHLFGKSCIERWMGSCKPPRCPKCNDSFKKKDIRPIFATNLRVVDTATEDELKQQVDNEKKVKLQAMNELANIKRDMTILKNENERLKRVVVERTQQLEAMRTGSKPIGMLQKLDLQNLKPRPSQHFTTSLRPFKLVKSLEVSKDGSCRVMSSSRTLDTIAISAQNLTSNPAFSSYGVRRVTSHDFRLSDFIPLHTKKIRDMSFKPLEPILLTVSQDKTLKVSSFIHKSSNITMKLDIDGWSCCWHPTNPNSCFVGGSRGIIQEFDVRNPKQPVQRFELESEAPLTSVHFVAGKEPDHPTGMFCNTLKQCFFCSINEKSGKQEQVVKFPFQGTCLPVHYDNECNFGVLSTRASEEYQTSNEHIVIDFGVSSSSNLFDSPLVSSFKGGRKCHAMTRPKIFNNPESFHKQAFVFVNDEESSSVLCYDTEEQRIAQKIPIKDSALDIDTVPADSINNMKIIILTETDLTLFERK